jgi:hypothetical protein
VFRRLHVHSKFTHLQTQTFDMSNIVYNEMAVALTNLNPLAPLIVTVVIVVALVAMLIFKKVNKSTPAAAAPTPIAAAPAAPAAASSSKPKRAAKSPAPAAKSPTPPAKSPAKSPAPAPAPAPVSQLAALTHQPDRNGGSPRRFRPDHCCRRL